jgi:hypothetical protein
VNIVKDASVRTERLILRPFEEGDLDILHRQPGQGGNALCHGWYIEGQTLSLLYNGKTVDVLNPALLRVSVTGGLYFNP